MVVSNRLTTNKSGAYYLLSSPFGSVYFLNFAFVQKKIFPFKIGCGWQYRSCENVHPLNCFLWHYSRPHLVHLIRFSIVYLCLYISIWLLCLFMCLYFLYMCLYFVSFCIYLSLLLGIEPGGRGGVVFLFFGGGVGGEINNGLYIGVRRHGSICLSTGGSRKIRIFQTIAEVQGGV